jgi:hypothetical protein
MGQINSKRITLKKNMEQINSNSNKLILNLNKIMKKLEEIDTTNKIVLPQYTKSTKKKVINIKKKYKR